MNNATRYVLILLVGIFVGVGITIERAAQAERQAVRANAGALPAEAIRTLTDVFGLVKSDYVEDVDDTKLLNDAIQGMLSGLDPHSAYLDPESFKDLKVSTEGEFGGLGIEVNMENGFVKVVSPIEDTPAAKAGLKTGDLIIKLDDKAVKGLTLNDAVKLMRGRPGTDIVLTVVREGQDRPLKFTVKRAVIKVQSVKHQMLDDGFGYVRITQFQANTGDSLKDALNKLKLQNKGDLKGMVLDLRNNPGGVLNAAVSVSDAFLTKGVIVSTKGRVADAEQRQTATPTDYLNGAPIVVLVNGGSASASEIVAGALQDNKRAVIMGTRTFGKGSVQTILPMNNGAALKLTTARYYTPSGRSIQAKGIEPDIITEEAKITKRDGADDLLRESDLAGHLENPNAAPATTTPKATRTLKPAGPSEDYQVQEALNLLKGVVIFRGSR